MENDVLQIKYMDWNISEIYEEKTKILYIGLNFNKSIAELIDEVRMVKKMKPINQNNYIDHNDNRGRRAI